MVGARPRAIPVSVAMCAQTVRVASRICIIWTTNRTPSVMADSGRDRGLVVVSIWAVSSMMTSSMMATSVMPSMMASMALTRVCVGFCGNERLRDTSTISSSTSLIDLGKRCVSRWLRYPITMPECSIRIAISLISCLPSFLPRIASVVRVPDAHHV